MSSVHDNTMVWAQTAVHYFVPNSFKGMTNLVERILFLTLSQYSLRELHSRITED